MKTIWKVLLAAAGVIVVILVAAVVIFGLFWGRNGGYGWMMPYYGGRGIREFGPWMWGGFGLFGFLMMLLMMGIPVGVLVLLVLGVAGLLRRPEAPPPAVAPASPAGKTCQNCGRPVEADWINCPYCGTKI